MTRTALYARFSTDLQSERSIDDQLALCRAFAVREGLEVVADYADRAKSGASVLGRDGLMALMVAAKARAFDVLVVEHTDRLSRDMGDLADIHKRLVFAGIAIRAVHSGGAALDTASIGLFGLVGQMQREDGAKKVRRGLAGVVRDGRHAGGCAYGYRPVPGRPGELTIDQEEAAVVRRIFAAYAAGDTPRAIAAALNRDHVRPPRGDLWNASTLNGNEKRGSGVLQNQLYAGAIVWNKVRMVKDPDTGRRVSRVNAEVEHVRTAAPHLTIVDAATFAAARLRKMQVGRTPARLARRPKRLLSGLLRCGVCGGGMSIKDKDRSGKTRLQCGRVRETGTCTHRRTYYAQAIEATVLDGLAAELKHPTLVADFLEEYRAERRRLARDRTARVARLARRAGEVDREIERIVAAIASGELPPGTIGRRLHDLEAERATIAESRGADDSDSVVALHPGAVQRYLRQIEDLSACLTAGQGTDSSAAAILRDLIDSVVVHPVPALAPLDIEIRGRLSELIHAPTLAPSCRLYGESMVAEDRYPHKPTHYFMIRIQTLKLARS